MPIQIGGGRAPGFEAPLALLRACHRRIERHLDLVERLVETLRREGTCAEQSEAVASVTGYFDRAGVLHTEDEERSLLPRLESRLGDADAAARATLAQLRTEHRAAEAAYRVLRERLLGLGDRPTAADLDRLQAALEQTSEIYLPHLEREEKSVFPVAEQLFDPATLAEMTEEMQRRRRP